ncbi:proline hydroxylase [Streptomyces sp. SCL15-4]|uniref:2OG-Fe(II)-dependent halogenase WelO5 family protein n=1 Tax=Streptomyces sp. SCL15-4 TaxID=2967221 RepID=UPI002965F801|nr:proline hydroxylase [Streptomyces sp. SCL15-4]
MSGATHDPVFPAVEAVAFTRQHIDDLAAGLLGTVRVPGFFGRPALDTMLTSLHRIPVVSFDLDRMQHPMARFGTALNDYRTPELALDAGRYWHDADTARRQWAEIRMTPDPLELALDALGRAWGVRPVPATVGGRPAFVGMLREVNDGTFIHYDDINREYRGGLFDQKVVAQLAFNAWLTAPLEGGTTTVWRHRWEPADEDRRHGYGFQPTAVENDPYVTLSPTAGDALLFNANNYHIVRPSAPGQRRIALACFLGITAGGELVIWS